MEGVERNRGGARRILGGEFSFVTRGESTLALAERKTFFAVPFLLVVQGAEKRA